MKRTSYLKFTLMMSMSFITMYLVMFLNVDEFSHIYFSLTRLYMTLLMVTPMAVMMILMMPKMYTHVKTNLIIISTSVLFFVLALTGLRKQVFISDVQYMKAMIPHHSSAILTSESAKIQNPKVRKLADDIIKAQKQEIAEMKSLLEEIE